MNKNRNEDGNVIFFIMLGVLLLGLVTAAIRNSGIQGANIDKETLIPTQAASGNILTSWNGALPLFCAAASVRSISGLPTAMRPATTAPLQTTLSVRSFTAMAAGAEYRLPPGSVNDGSPWEFYGNSHLPEVGTSRADLIAVLPNVTTEFCTHINDLIGYSTQPLDTGAPPAVFMPASASVLTIQTSMIRPPTRLMKEPSALNRPCRAA